MKRTWFEILWVAVLMAVGYPLVSVMVRMEVTRQFKAERSAFIQFAAEAGREAPEVLDLVIEQMETSANVAPNPNADPNSAGDGGRVHGEAERAN